MTIPALHKLDTPIALGALKSRVAEPVLAQTCGDDVIIEAVASLGDAAPGALSFCKNSGNRGASLTADSKASLILVSEAFDIPVDDDSDYLTVANPARWFVRAVSHLFPEEGKGYVHPTAVVEEGAQVGSGCRIGSGTFIGRDVILGTNCRIGPNCSLGGAGLAIEYDENGVLLPYPHLGRLIVGAAVTIGANCVVVRGILESTEIGERTTIGNMVNIGHNCRIGENCWISSGTVLCGSAILGKGVMVGANVTVNNHVNVGAGGILGLGSVVTKSVATGRRVFGVPAKPLKTMRAL
ncbi:MAG: hypothetical protein OXC93_12355 [Rhodospirillaceae bacterium]|nr:hypothetical protein [Rhodospirillaceae bacterium]